MNSCPISLEHLFLLIGAFEGLSLWEVLEKFSDKIKGIYLSFGGLFRDEILALNRNWFYKFKVCFFVLVPFFFFSFCSRGLKWIPTFVFAGALVFYSACPVLRSQSASMVFYAHWKLICGIIAIGASLQLFLFMCTWGYFSYFINQYNHTVKFDDRDPQLEDFKVV